MRAQQKIVVNTKGGLIAAFECAINGDPDCDLLETEIILKRASGETRYNLKCGYDWIYKMEHKRTPYFTQEKTVCKLAKDSSTAQIRRAKTRLRRIPAKELLA